MPKFFADAHSCLPLRADTDIKQLDLHYKSGVRYVSINVGMDLNPLEQIISTIASFRAQIAASENYILAEKYSDIEFAIKNNKLAVSFDLEGALPLLELPEMVALYHHLGVRQIHLSYNRNNSIAGGAHDTEQGLSALGVKIVAAINKHGILMDLSHNSEKCARDICEISASPVLYSHANPRNHYNHQRNISDEIMRKVAQTGGLICLNGVGRFLNDMDLKPETLAQVIDYAVQIVGINHVGVGLDYCYDDGISDILSDVDRDFWWPPSAGYSGGLSGVYMSPEALPAVFSHLEKIGYKNDDLEALAYKNLFNLIKKVWH